MIRLKHKRIFRFDLPAARGYYVALKDLLSLYEDDIKNHSNNPLIRNITTLKEYYEKFIEWDGTKRNLQKIREKAKEAIKNDRTNSLLPDVQKVCRSNREERADILPVSSRSERASCCCDAKTAEH